MRRSGRRGRSAPPDRESRSPRHSSRAGAGRAQPTGKGGKRSTGYRTAAQSTRSGGQRGRPRGSKPKTLRSRLARVSPRTAILLMLLVIFVVLSISPVTRNLEATGRLRKMKAEFKKEKAVTDSLEKEVSEARSAEYVETEARRQRMVAPGEVLYLVTADSSEGEVKYRVKALQSMEEAWERVRQLLHSVPRR